MVKAVTVNRIMATKRVMATLMATLVATSAETRINDAATITAIIVTIATTVITAVTETTAKTAVVTRTTRTIDISLEIRRTIAVPILLTTETIETGAVAPHVTTIVNAALHRDLPQRVFGPD